MDQALKGVPEVGDLSENQKITFEINENEYFKCYFNTLAICDLK